MGMKDKSKYFLADWICWKSCKSFKPACHFQVLTPSAPHLPRTASSTSPSVQPRDQSQHRAELGRCVLGPKTVWTNSNRFNDALNKWRKGQFWLSNFKFSCFINPGYLFLFLKKTENKSSRLDLNIYKHRDVSSYEHLNFSVCISQTFRYPESSHKSLIV